MNNSYMFLRPMISRIIDCSPQYRRPVKTKDELLSFVAERFTGIYVEDVDDIFLWHPDVDGGWLSSVQFRDAIEKIYANPLNPILRQCPYCVNDIGVEIKETVPLFNPEPKKYYIWCHRCKARGPIKSTAEQAISTWNAVSLKHKGCM